MKTDMGMHINKIINNVMVEGYKKTRLGLLPNDWSVKRIDEIAFINPSKPKLEDDDMVSFLGMAGVSESAKIISLETKNYCEVSKGFTPFVENDILVAKITPCFENGKGAFAKNLENGVGFGSTEFHVIRSENLIDQGFLYYHTRSTRFRKTGEVNMTGTAGQKRVPTGFIESYAVQYPQNSDERSKIVDILSTWDKAIELKENLIAEKKNQKNGLMQKLLTGKVRLPGFDGEWKEVKLGTILKKVNEKSHITSELELYSLTIENGVTPKTDRYNREFLVKADNKKYKITKLNDIVYNPANLRFGAIAVNRINNPVLLSPIYEVLRLKSDRLFSLDFIGQLLTWDRTINLFSTMAEGTLIERMAVKIDTFLKVEFKIPISIEEQTAIAFRLDLADKEINLLEKEIVQIKEQKKGLMQLLLTGIVRVNTQEN